MKKKNDIKWKKWLACNTPAPRSYRQWYSEEMDTGATSSGVKF